MKVTRAERSIFFNDVECGDFFYLNGCKYMRCRCGDKEEGMAVDSKGNVIHVPYAKAVGPDIKSSPLVELNYGEVFKHEGILCMKVKSKGDCAECISLDSGYDFYIPCSTVVHPVHAELIYHDVD